MNGLHMVEDENEPQLSVTDLARMIDEAEAQHAKALAAVETACDFEKKVRDTVGALKARMATRMGFRPAAPRGTERTRQSRVPHGDMASAILKELSTGPKSVSDLLHAIGGNRASIATCVGFLAREGRAKRVGRGVYMAKAS